MTQIGCRNYKSFLLWCCLLTVGSLANVRPGSVPAYPSAVSHAGAGLAWGAMTNGVQMSIRSAKGATLATNSPVIIVLRYKLTSTNGFIFTAGRPIEQTMGLQFTVISPDGKDISPALSETENQSARPRFVILRPGEETEIQYDLSKRCSFDKPGVYKITAAHFLVRHPQKGGRFRVTSNPLGVKITATNLTAMSTQNS